MVVSIGFAAQDARREHCCSIPTTHRLTNRLPCSPLATEIVVLAFVFMTDAIMVGVVHVCFIYSSRFASKIITEIILEQLRISEYAVASRQGSHLANYFVSRRSVESW